ncbi:hypothetical protein FEM54_02660 [Pseudomonas edaphica]|uniref:Uncharacterized protein n=1 Tax=Pseudomonas edaphica TaxID=2006980 RepID=A0ABY2UAR0_9PSED|nr:hypothetical protein FEM54_02660 [Pseudomonas edaphica]
MGAGLARDAGTSVCQLHLGDAIAGKPAPTQSQLPHGSSVVLRFRLHHPLHHPRHRPSSPAP